MEVYETVAELAYCINLILHLWGKIEFWEMMPWPDTNIQLLTMRNSQETTNAPKNKTKTNIFQLLLIKYLP